MNIEVSAAAPGDAALLADLINRAYAEGEAGLWIDGTKRTGATAVAEMIHAGELLTATVEGRIAGCARLRTLDVTTAEVGLVSTDPQAWGGGIGRALVAAAEGVARSRGATAMQLQVLAPRDRSHPGKDRLRAWYERLGYRLERAEPFASPRLAMPCEFLILRKPLN